MPEAAREGQQVQRKGQRPNEAKHPAGEAWGSGAMVAKSTAAWARYAEEVMRPTSEAGQALLRTRTLSEMLEVQAKLLRDNMQAFLDQAATIAEAASRMATRPFGALKELSTDQPRR